MYTSTHRSPTAVVSALFGSRLRSLRLGKVGARVGTLAVSSLLPAVPVLLIVALVAMAYTCIYI